MSYISDLRKYVGHAPIMAPAATGIIINKDKKILFEKRTDNGMWCVPGGALELGESFEEGLKREIKEETNLDIYNPVLFDVNSNIYMHYPNGDEVYYTDGVFIIREFSGKLKCDSESEELRWFGIDELPDSILSAQHIYLSKFKDEVKNGKIKL